MIGGGWIFEARVGTSGRRGFKRAAVLAAEIVGLTLAMLSACVLFIGWRLERGAIDVSWLEPAVRVAANLSGGESQLRSIDRITLAKGDQPGRYDLSFADMRLGRRSGEASALLPIVVATYEARDLVRFRMTPGRLSITGAEIRVTRRADRRLRLEFGGADSRAQILDRFTTQGYFRRLFRFVSVTDARLVFVDLGSGRTWIGRDGEIELRRTKSGCEARADAAFDIERAPASLSMNARYDLADDVVTATMRLERAPIGDIIDTFLGARGVSYTGPVSGMASLTLDGRGEVKAALLEAVAAPGELEISGVRTKFERIAAGGAFDPAARSFDIRRIDWKGEIGEGSLAGDVRLSKSDRKADRSIGFRLAGGPTIVAAKRRLSVPAKLDSWAIEGSLDPSQRVFDVKKARLDFPDFDIDGALRYASRRKDEDGAPGVKGAFKATGVLSRDEVLALWPLGVAAAAREFVATRVPVGEFHGISAAVDLDDGAVIANGALPNEALTLSFAARGAEVVYAPGMTPLVGLVGEGVVRGNSFRFTAREAKAGALSVERGEVDIPVLAPKGERAFFRFTAKGDAGEMMRILAQPPLAVLRETDLRPDQFSGRVTATVEIGRPNISIAPRDAYSLSGRATFDNVAVVDLYKDVSLSGAVGRLDLETSGLRVVTEAKLGETPLTIDWRQRFYGKGDKSTYLVSGVADSSTADLFGLPSRRVLQGAVPFSLRATGNQKHFSSLALEADLSAATVLVEALGWIKPAATAAKLAATVAFSDGGVVLEQGKVTGDGVVVRTSARFAGDGRLDAFDAERFFLRGAADLKARATRDDAGALTVAVEGAYLDAGVLARQVADGTILKPRAGAKPGAGLRLKANIDAVALRNGVRFGDVDLTLDRKEETLRAFSLSAREPNGVLAAALNPGQDGAGGAVIARTTDVGSLLSGVYGLTSIDGGVGTLSYVLPSRGDESEIGAGRLTATDLRIVKAPLLARIFAAGSLTGLSDLLNGDGIEIERASAAFTMRDGALILKEARATGPSVGITASGEAELEGERRIALNGAVAPAYGVNSILGSTPVIGDLFVNRKGEGLISLAYDVAGPLNEPRVTINPLSALAPGALRRLFEIDTPDVPQTDEGDDGPDR